MKLTEQEHEELIANLPRGWKDVIYLKKKKKVSKRTIQRIVHEKGIDLHGIMPLAVRIATKEIVRKAMEVKDLKGATTEFKKALRK